MQYYFYIVLRPIERKIILGIIWWNETRKKEQHMCRLNKTTFIIWRVFEEVLEGIWKMMCKYHKMKIIQILSSYWSMRMVDTLALSKSMAFMREPWKYLTLVCWRLSSPSNSRSGSALQVTGLEYFIKSLIAMLVNDKIFDDKIGKRQYMRKQVRSFNYHILLITDLKSWRSKISRISSKIYLVWWIIHDFSKNVYLKYNYLLIKWPLI